MLALEPALVRARNATRRGPHRARAAVSRQLDDLERSLRHGGLEAEGFAAVHVLRTARELDELAVEVRPPTPPR